MSSPEEPEFFLPKRQKPKTILTPAMKEVINRSLSVHHLSALIVWYGVGRVGKTTTGGYLVDWLNKRFDANDPFSFRGFHYQIGKIIKGSGNEWKQAIRSLYQAALQSQMDEGFYIRNPPEVLARQTVHGLRRLNIQLVIVDEAARLSPDAIQAMALVRDIADEEGWTLTIIFIGKDDLPRLMTKVEHVHKRVLEWCHFREYSLDDTWAFLSELHPYFASLNAKKAEHRAQVETVHELCAGLPGFIVLLIQKLDYRLRNYIGIVDAKFIRAVHELSNKSMMDSLKQSGLPYRPYKTKSRSDKPQNGSNVSSPSSKRNKKK